VDVTAHEDALRKLLRSEEIHRSLVEECPFGIFCYNINREYVEHVNSAFLHCLDYTIEELRTRPMVQLFETPGDRHRLIGQLRETGTLRDFETHVIAKNGTRLHLSISGYLAPGERQEQLLQGYVHDITRQRELEGKLNHSHRMEAIGRLAGGVAHDFNNITQSISLSCELALQGALPPHLESKLLDIMRQTTRAAEITRQLLAFSRRQVLRPRVVDLNDCLRKSLPLLMRTVGMNTSIELSLDEMAEHVYIDPEQLTLVMMHLADNAHEAMPRGGLFRIATGAFPGNAVSVNDNSHELSTVLTISDTGVGMDQNTLRHIFEPFFSTKGPTVTSGLGLSTVHGIIAQSRGRIECSSTPGQGSTFRIFLPVAHSPSEAPATVRCSPAAAKLLLAEDDPIVNKHLVHALQKAGFSVDSVSNGEEGLATFDAGRHQLVVTDILMPKLDGLEMTRELHQRNPSLPVVLISGFSDEIGELKDFPQQLVYCLQKPFEIAKLVTAIRELLAKSREVS
jgi:hypothetical protein